MIMRSDLERPPFGRELTNLPKNVQTIKERSDHLHLPIMH
jgi:hypothetical protein